MLPGRMTDVPNGQPISDELVIRAQQGDVQLREKIIESCIPWIKKIVRKHAYMISDENSDEYSLALEAFNTAIDRFSPAKKIPFPSYAAIIIRNKLIDWSRLRSTGRREQSFSDMDSGTTPYEDRIEDTRSGIAFADIESEDSMIAVEYQLSRFGLSMGKLADHFPKQRNTLLFCVQMARVLANDKQLFDKTMESCRLPVSELARQKDASVKMIDKHRSCIIFLAILLQSDLFLIRSYVAILEKEASQ